MSTLNPFRLHPSFSERTWGRRDLKPWYPDWVERDAKYKDPIGEAWLTGPQSLVNDGDYAGETLASLAGKEPVRLLGILAKEKEFPLLMKLLFPDDKLSVQVHPNDEEAAALNIGRGKTECWYILDAEPGATVACGLKQGTTLDGLRDAIANGTAENLLEHIPVVAGDMVFVDAGTVHAIGPGVTILETQQTSDTTYRLYDYGRPRELHVDKGLAVSKVTTRAGKVEAKPISVDGREGKRLIQEKYFTVDSFSLKIGDTIEFENPGDKPYCLTAIGGDAQVIVVGEALTELPASTSVIVPADVARVTVRADSALELVRATP
ncbi:type I phosphomannose isomerase catalytic subunit [Terriglobus roseus]|uniref:Mannose-6-phosphate isomerase, type 1 n=1 Tax=Terriglobus roseus TaxID=392734 RepID=A0A1G7Q246_9BACT|nr:type I phosphomannose isomerase catalytic subunit [Terriglobus roseus]SDF92657.1 mannose-6-phosphate isomerase, type 1 [Terriglobus roseus]